MCVCAAAGGLALREEAELATRLLRHEDQALARLGVRTHLLAELRDHLRRPPPSPSLSCLPVVLLPPLSSCCCYCW